MIHGELYHDIGNLPQEVSKNIESQYLEEIFTVSFRGIGGRLVVLNVPNARSMSLIPSMSCVYNIFKTIQWNMHSPNSIIRMGFIKLLCIILFDVWSSQCQVFLVGVQPFFDHTVRSAPSQVYLFGVGMMIGYGIENPQGLQLGIVFCHFYSGPARSSLQYLINRATPSKISSRET